MRDDLRKVSGKIWSEKQNAENLGVPWNEEPITEWLLIQLAKLGKTTGNFHVRAFSKSEEKKNGADWEFCFKSKNKRVNLRIQSKRLFTSGRYESLFKTPNKAKGIAKYDQFDKLEKHSTVAKPLFLLYNFPAAFPNHGKSIAFICESKKKYRQPSFWGCSICTPAFVRRMDTDVSSVLLEGMKPFFCLDCSCSIKSSADLTTRIENSLRKLPDSPKKLEYVSTFPTDWEAALKDSDNSQLSKYCDAMDLAGVALIEEL